MPSTAHDLIIKARTGLFLLGLAVLAAMAPQRLLAQASHTTDSPRAEEAGFVGGEGSANWELASRWAPYNTGDMLYSVTVSPRWIQGTDDFWYEWEDADGTWYYIVDPTTRTKREIFDRDALAAELTRITRDPWDGQNLPIDNVRFIDGNTLQFDVDVSKDPDGPRAAGEEEGDTQVEGDEDEGEDDDIVFHFEFEIDSQTLRRLEDFEEPDDHPNWASVSPDGQRVVFARDHNLYSITGAEYAEILDARRGKSGDDAEEAEDSVDVNEVQLTTDGEAYYSYMANSSGRGVNDVDKEEEWAKRHRAAISWSHDSNKFALVRSDQREVGLLFVIHNTGHDRQEVESYKYDMPGEEDVTQQAIHVFDFADMEMTTIDDDPWKDQSMSVVSERTFVYPDDTSPRVTRWFTENPNELWFTRESRDRHRIDLMKADLTTGTVMPVVEERLNTYQERQNPWRLSDGTFVWWSERDGWAHLYRYGVDGTLIARLTAGPWHVDGVARVDPATDRIFFTAMGREEDIDPYYAHLYRVDSSGSGLVRVSEGDYDNRASMPENASYVVHSFSRVNTVPQTVVRGPGGDVLMELETADVSALEAAGWQMPEPFRIEAADGYTDIYGVMYRPFDFDSTKVYPIVQYVYPGPQTESVSKFFTTNSYEVGLAQLGFVVVTLGNRGGHPDRSKWYHNYSYGNLRDYGLADKVAGVEQLADRYSFIDRNRVGIYGHSGGGFMSTAALLNYPDVYDVAVSSAGNHDNQIYNRWWSETHHGVDEVVDSAGEVGFEYEIDNNIELAPYLKGKLLLTTGDVDNNVHPANTIRMAKALIDANKRFDYFIFPSQRHGFGSMSDYWFWLRVEYFARHLLGDSRTASDIAELNAEGERR
ncbi:MAG: S9 family peptidase [Gemmatimonadetes bacterium]|nr:S9 family peptidase [Gemmatimonadota bacterium]